MEVTSEMGFLKKTKKETFAIFNSRGRPEVSQKK